MLTVESAAFDAWVKAVGGATKAAAILGCSVPHVSLMRQGKRRPGRALAWKIQLNAGVFAGGWNE